MFLPDPKHFGHSPEPPHIGHLERKIGKAGYPSFDFALAAPPSDFTGLRFDEELKRRNWSVTQTRNIGCFAFLRTSMTRSGWSSR